MIKIVGTIVVIALSACGDSPEQNGTVTIEFRIAETEPAHGLFEMKIQRTDETFYLHEDVVLSNVDVASTSVTMWNNRPVVELIFTETGGKKFAALTQANIHKHIGMVVNGTLVSAPIIQAPILAGKAIIDGNFTLEVAQRIAKGISKGQPQVKMPKFRKEDAEQLMQLYMQALRSGDKEEIYRFWSTHSLEREGFDYMHLWIGACLPISDWSEFFEQNHCTYDIKEIRAEHDHYIIDFEWILKEPSDMKRDPETHIMRYYVVWENDTWVLMNPIDLLTRNWLTHESEHFLFHYPPNIEIETFIPEFTFMDQECQRLFEFLNIKLEDKINYYKARTPQKCGELICFPPANGYCVRAHPFRPDAPRWFHIVVSTSFINLHEVTHLLAPDAELYSISAAFDEGIAVAFGGTTFQTAELAFIQTKNAIGHPEYVPIDVLLTDEAAFWENPFLTYQEAGAFVRFLIDQFDLEKLKELCSEPDVAHKLDKTIHNIYGYSIKELENRMIDHLIQMNVPDVRYSIPEDAELVFSMTDPQGDDLGDGDYEYPTDERFEKGVFDLRKFQVLKDAEHIYFRLKFQRMINPVKYDFTGEKFVPGTVIAIYKGNTKKRHLQRRFDGIQLENGKGYDLKITVGSGITVSNNYGKVYYSAGDILHGVGNERENMIEFSFPIEFVGEPESDWKYFVGVGLTGDRTIHFFGGPMPVYKDHGLFISGGNYQSGNPAFIDILLPEEIDQAQILADYDASEGRMAVVPMVYQN